MPSSTTKQLSLPAEGSGSYAWWRAQIEWSTDSRKPLIDKWRLNVNAYRDEVNSPQPNATRVNVEFEKTEQKKHQLFFQVPKIRLKPTPRTARESQPPPQDPNTPQAAPPDVRDLKKAVAIFQEVLEHEAGPRGINSKSLMDQLIFDVLCPSGIAACKVGYERTVSGTLPIQVGTELDPVTGAPRPLMGEAPNIIYERYFASRISPGQLLIPSDFTGMDYSREADWLGRDFTISATEAAQRGWKVDPALQSSSTTDDDNRLVQLDMKGQHKAQLRGQEVFYFASRVDPKVLHPLAIRRLIFIDGQPEPALHQDYKDQTFDQNGRFVKGVKALPIKVLTLRYVSDHPYPPSDCTISRRQADELSEFRTQMSTHRKKATPLRWINLERIVDERVKRLVEKGEYYDIIPVEGDGGQFMGEIARPVYPRENFEISDRMMADVNRQWALGANQSSTRETGGTTATEIAAIEKATANRLSGEQQVVMGFWLSIIETLGHLKQIYADREDYVEVVGEAGVKAIEAWDRDTIRGEFLYRILPDSASRPDAESDRELALNRYNLLANDPYANREELYRETVEVYGGDPDRLTQQPPEPDPEKPRVSIAIKGDDLNPMMPQYQNVVNLLIQAGVPKDMVSPPQAAQAQAQPQVTGPAEVVDREHLRMSRADEHGDGRAGGLQGVLSTTGVGV